MSITILLLVTTAVTIFGGMFAFSNSVYAQSTIFLACAAPPGQNPAPSDGTTLNYAVINNGRIDFTEVIPDNTAGNARGWDPTGSDTIFVVSDVPPGAEATSSSVIAVSTNDFVSWNLCGANLVSSPFFAAAEAANDTKLANLTASQ
jgi:hypothetical protein